VEVDAAGLRRARVRAQVLGRSGTRDLDDVVRTVVGVQAQDRGAAALAFRARSGAARAGDVAGAWSSNGPLVLTWGLRGTRHLHHRDDVRWLLSIFGPVFAGGAPARNRQLGIAGATGDRAVRAVRNSLRRRGPLTRAQVKEVLARRGVEVSGQAPIHVLRRAALEGVLCVVPDADGEETYVPLEDRAPAAAPPEREDALAELARRYLRGYGPATPGDLVAWSGLARRDAEAAWRTVAEELAEVATPAGRMWILRASSRTVNAAVRTPGPVRLLPAFDTLLLGYADRTPVVSARHARRVNAGGGMVRPTVLTDEGVVGTWRLRRGRDGTPLVDVDAFGRLGPGVREDLEREVGAVTRFVRSDRERRRG
jgi:winged helix DNA-binding protein